MLTDATRAWYAMAVSKDGTKLVTSCYDGCIYTSADGGNTWLNRMPGSTTNWLSVAASDYGHQIIATGDNAQLYVATLTGTTTGTSGSLTGQQNVSVKLTYQGNGQFAVTSHSWTLSVR